VFRGRRRDGVPRALSIRALVFDFDGLILETELPDYQSWREVYQEHGQDLSMKVWSDVIGRGAEYFDPYQELVAKLGHDLDRVAVLNRRKARHREMIAALEVLPGVREAIAEAKRLGLRLGVASSSSRAWVTGHLARLGLTDFECVCARDDVVNAKPHPDLYLAACACLDVAPAEAVALEDSANGIAAAKAAGLRCIAIPNPMTAGLDLSAADLRLESLSELSLEDLLGRFR
jgi:HAD superfamily hydrolase (TIGR01509 family)